MESAHGRPTAVLALVAVALGLVLVIGAAVALGHGRRTPQPFGVVAASASARQVANPGPSAVRVTDGPSGALAPPTAAPARPTRVRVPALRVSAPVQGVVTRNGLLGVPQDIRHVGWWTGSVRPGSRTGATVLVGHVDSAVDGEGALFHLTDLRPGQQVIVSTAAIGSSVSYRVYARRVYSKSRALPMSLFSRTGPARLILITCGGPFDAAASSYLDNIAVFARPAASDSHR